MPLIGPCGLTYTVHPQENTTSWSIKLSADAITPPAVYPCVCVRAAVGLSPGCSRGTKGGQPRGSTSCPRAEPTRQITALMPLWNDGIWQAKLPIAWPLLATAAVHKGRLIPPRPQTAGCPLGWATRMRIKAAPSWEGRPVEKTYVICSHRLIYWIISSCFLY